MSIYLKKFKNILNNVLIFISSDGFKYVNKYNKNAIAYVMVLTIAFTVVSISQSYSEAKNTLISIDKNYNGYMDIDYYCESVGCEYVLKNEHLIKIDDMSVEKHDHHDLLFIKNYTLYIAIEYRGVIYYVNILDNILNSIFYSMAILIFIILETFIFVYNVVNDERLNMIFNIHNKNTEMQHEILFNMANNLNHEVKSPVLVLRSIINELRDSINNNIKTNNQCGLLCVKDMNIIEDFSELLDMGDMAIKQISVSVNSLSEYRNINVSEDPIDIYTLTSMAIKMLDKTNVDKFMYKNIDKKLKKYMVSNKNGMPNAFYISTIINHAKNSLEANANSLSVILHDIDKNYLYIDVLDNGDGIPDDVAKHIFDLHYTTKTITKGERGTGLYTNNLLISNLYGGSITNIPVEHGALFRIKMKYGLYEYKEII